MAESARATRLEAAVLEVLSGRRRGPLPALLRGLLAMLSLAYCAGLKLYLIPYRLGIRKKARLGVPVVSIGNIASGGTGKTGMTLFTAEAANRMGVRVCVLSRGYLGAHEHDAAVVSDGRRVLLSPAEAGDEPYLLASALPGVPVIVGKDRRRTGRMALERFGPELVLLDDGMQYYQLHRDLDIVVVNALKPFENGWTFPRGLLREPPGHLARAHWIVISQARRLDARNLEVLKQTLARIAPKAQITTADYQPVGLVRLGSAECEPVDQLRGRNVATFCALGSPESFEDQVREAGMVPVHSCRLPDHSKPEMTDLVDLMDGATRAGATAVIVSEKDAVKLPVIQKPLPMFALRVRMHVADGDALLASICSLRDGTT